jgi:hypothetical protein
MAAKTITTITKKEKELNNMLKSILINWELINTINLESKFSAMRLISHSTSIFNFV